MEGELVPETAVYPVLQAVIQDLARVPARFPVSIHEDDEMFLFALQRFEGDRVRSLVDYYVTGSRIFQAVKQIIEWCFQRLERVSAFLDFACGYGRFTRCLLQELPASRVWACDIYANAVKYQQELFGVNGVVSVSDPANLHIGTKFDCIIASSFFTHMPEATFTRWLRKLYGMLNAPGILMMSVSDIDLLPPEAPERARGFYFEPESESRTLDKHEYGTTYVGEEYLAQAIAQLAPGKSSYVRIKKGLNYHQDVYVVGNQLDPRLPALRFNYYPVGNLDLCQATSPDELLLVGWTADFNPGGRVEEIQLIVNGKVLQRTAPEMERPDVAEHYQDPSILHSGWLFKLNKSGFGPNDTVVLKAINSSKVQNILCACTVSELPKRFASS